MLNKLLKPLLPFLCSCMSIASHIIPLTSTAMITNSKVRSHCTEKTKTLRKTCCVARFLSGHHFDTLWMKDYLAWSSIRIIRPRSDIKSHRLSTGCTGTRAASMTRETAASQGAAFVSVCMLYLQRCLVSGMCHITCLSAICIMTCKSAISLCIHINYVHSRD